jgi:hypothetical protein
MRRLVLCLLLATACESDAKKLERLQQDAAIASLRAQQLAEDYRALPDGDERARALLDSVRQAETAATLARRDLNRFMGGR